MYKSLLVLVALLAGFQGNTQNKNFLDQPYIETSAAVDTLVVPDRIFLNIMVTEKDTKGRISVEELEPKMETALQNLGIDTKKNLSMEDVASNFKKYFLKTQDVLTAKSYNLMVGDAITAGRVVVALEDLGISNVRLTRTEYSAEADLLLHLRTKAITRARAQADFLTRPLGQHIGKAVYISDLERPIVPATYQGDMRYMVLRGNQDKTAADIEFAKIKVECRVEVKFLLQ